MKKEDLDLKTLEYVRSIFMLYSDHSTKCLGFWSIEKLIEELTTNGE